MGAGHETTATTAAAAIYCVAAHPGVRERLLAELDGVLGGWGCRRVVHTLCPGGMDISCSCLRRVTSRCCHADISCRQLARLARGSAP